MNLLLFLLANSGQPLSFQRLTKALGVPAVAQTSRYVEFLADAYLLFPVPKFSLAFKKRVVAPPKYYAIDNGLRRVNSPQRQPDLGHRLENAVALHLRRGGAEFSYAGERDSWECDFVTRNEALQVCLELTPANRQREIGGGVAGARVAGLTRARILTLDQTDHLREDGVAIEVQPAWQWMEEQ
jgi:predicted AAA+ superfamily ATPase